MHLETDSNFVENRRVSNFATSKDLRRWAQGRQRNAFFFLVSRNKGKIGESVSDRVSKKALRGTGESKCEGRAFVGFAGCNFAVCKGAGCRDVQFMFATNVREVCEVEDPASPSVMCLRGPQKLALRNIARRSQPRNRKCIFFIFSCLREEFPPFRAHLAITELPQA